MIWYSVAVDLITSQASALRMLPRLCKYLKYDSLYYRFPIRSLSQYALFFLYACCCVAVNTSIHIVSPSG